MDYFRFRKTDDTININQNDKATANGYGNRNYFIMMGTKNNGIDNGVGLRGCLCLVKWVWSSWL